MRLCIGASHGSCSRRVFAALWMVVMFQINAARRDITADIEREVGPLPPPPPGVVPLLVGGCPDTLIKLVPTDLVAPAPAVEDGTRWLPHSPCDPALVHAVSTAVVAELGRRGAQGLSALQLLAALAGMEAVAQLTMGGGGSSAQGVLAWAVVAHWGQLAAQGWLLVLLYVCVCVCVWAWSQFATGMLGEAEWAGRGIRLQLGYCTHSDDARISTRFRNRSLLYGIWASLFGWWRLVQSLEVGAVAWLLQVSIHPPWVHNACRW
jgi:hypothetical protein